MKWTMAAICMPRLWLACAARCVSWECSSLCERGVSDGRRCVRWPTKREKWPLAVLIVRSLRLRPGASGYWLIALSVTTMIGKL